MNTLIIESCASSCSILAERILRALDSSASSLSVAESCTGGLLSYQFTRISGASSVFLGGIVSYSIQSKCSILGVKDSVIAAHSVYSDEVVDSMLKGVVERMGCDYAIATSGIAGPHGGSEKNPVGCVYMGVKTRQEDSIITRRVFNGTREEIQFQATLGAMELFIQSYL